MKLVSVTNLGEKKGSFRVVLLDNEDNSLLNNEQKMAIDEALEEAVSGRVQSHEDVMDETKKRFPHLFNR